ncbi:MAG TPA: hypothetical protein VKU00_05160 [Chthonomonadaceae bacterium]|nr:hypothetical protein [Chthonomonadaceae bacterium]
MKWERRSVEETRRRAALHLLAFGCGVALAWMQITLTGQIRDRIPFRTPPQSVGVRPMRWTQEPSGQVVEPAPPVVIDADATLTAPEDPTLLRTFCDAFSAASGQEAQAAVVTPASPPAKEAAAPTDGPDWFLWGRLGTERAAATLADPTLGEGLKLYAVHSPEGAALCLINRSEQKISIRLQLRLPKGVYKWERLSFAPPLPTGDRILLSAANLREGSEKRSLPLTCRLDRLQSVELPETDVVIKPGELQPGELCLYRCTDVSRAARAAVYETRMRLEELAQTAPDSAHRLRRILDGGGDFLDYLCAGSSSNRERRLSGIHHFLLVTAQAHSLHRNFQERHTVSIEAGAAAMGALERLMDGLAETSAAILGLVPKIVVEPEAAAMPAAQQNGETRSASLVTISIKNAGARSVEMVKVGLDTSALPAGVQCDPEDPAFFGTLYPGQTVRATFHVRCPASMPMPANRCVGDVSYFMAGAPAHLRPRPW